MWLQCQPLASDYRKVSPINRKVTPYPAIDYSCRHERRGFSLLCLVNRKVTTGFFFYPQGCFFSRKVSCSYPWMKKHTGVHLKTATINIVDMLETLGYQNCFKRYLCSSSHQSYKWPREARHVRTTARCLWLTVRLFLHVTAMSATLDYRKVSPINRKVTPYPAIDYSCRH